MFVDVFFVFFGLKFRLHIIIYLFCYRHCDIPQESVEHKAKFRLRTVSNEASHQSPELPGNTSRAKLACDM